jgi:hypothetical protein
VVVAITTIAAAGLLSGFIWNVMLALGLINDPDTQASNDAWWGVAWIGFPIVGGVILLHRRANTVGRLLLFTGACMAAVVATDSLLLQPAPRGSVWLEMPGMLAGFLGWIGLIGVVVAFPSGFGASRGARVLAWCLGCLALWISLMALASARMVNSARPNPLAVDALAGVSRWFVEGPGFTIVPTLVIASLVSQGLRWHRSQGVVRMQYRWFIAGVVFSMLALVIIGITAGDDDAAMEFSLVNILWAVPMNAVALAIGIAVSRYHLYELNRVISRSVSYSVVTVSLLAIYAAVVAAATAVLPSSSSFAVALGTLTAAALFRPILLRVRVSVDRRFNRERYDGELAVEQFADRMRQEVHPAVVSDELVATLEQTVRPSILTLWTREPIA